MSEVSKPDSFRAKEPTTKVLPSIVECKKKFEEITKRYMFKGSSETHLSLKGRVIKIANEDNPSELFSEKEISIINRITNRNIDPEFISVADIHQLAKTIFSKLKEKTKENYLIAFVLATKYLTEEKVLGPELRYLLDKILKINYTKEDIFTLETKILDELKWDLQPIYHEAFRIPF